MERSKEVFGAGDLRVAFFCAYVLYLRTLNTWQEGCSRCFLQPADATSQMIPRL